MKAANAEKPRALLFGSRIRGSLEEGEGKRELQKPQYRSLKEKKGLIRRQTKRRKRSQRALCILSVGRGKGENYLEEEKIHGC